MASKSNQKKRKRAYQQRLIADSKRIARRLKEETEHSSDRSLAIVIAALLNELLSILLRKHFVVPMKESNALFDGPTAPLSSFYSRILVAYNLGLISENFADDLQTVRSIRNCFAHDLEGLRFDSSDIRREMKKLDHLFAGLGENYLGLPERGRFFILGTLFIAELMDARKRVKKLRVAHLEDGYAWSRMLDVLDIK